MVSKEEIRNTALMVGALMGEVSQSMLPFGIQNHKLVSEVLEEMAQDGTLKRPYTGSYHFQLICDPTEVFVGALSEGELNLISANYGPSDEDGIWKLWLSTSGGSLVLNIDDAAAYDLWAEIKDVPYLPTTTSEVDKQRSDVLNKVLDADGSLVQYIDALLTGQENSLVPVRARVESAEESGEIDWETYVRCRKQIDALELLLADNGSADAL
jgi:hypothetical protein